MLMNIKHRSSMYRKKQYKWIYKWVSDQEGIYTNRCVHRWIHTSLYNKSLLLICSIRRFKSVSLDHHTVTLVNNSIESNWTLELNRIVMQYEGSAERSCAMMCEDRIELDVIESSNWVESTDWIELSNWIDWCKPFL